MPPVLALALALTGEVMSVDSHWTGDGSRIVSDVTLRTATGDVVVSQLGGTVDGLTMRVFDDQPLLHVGMFVQIAGHDGVDLSQVHHNVIDQIEVDYDPAAS